MQRFIGIMVVVIWGIQLDVQAQTGWMNGNIPQSDVFNYYVGEGQHTQIDSAKMLAIEDVKLQLSRKQGITYQIKGKSNLRIVNEQTGGENKSTTRYVWNSTSKETGRPVKTSITIVESQKQRLPANNEVVYKALVRVPKQGRKGKDMPLYTYTTTQAGWRSAVFPGWGQLYKGQFNPKEQVKGWTLLLGEIAFAGGIITSQAMYTHYHNEAYKTASTTQREVYLNNRDKWSKARYGFIGAAGIVYVYSLLDAALNKTTKRYAQQRHIKVSPFAGKVNGVSLVFTLK